MKYISYIVIVLAVVLLFYYGGVFNKQKSSPRNPVSAEQKQWETKTDEQPPVTIKVTPIELGIDAKTWKFAVVFDSHSGSLEDDPIKVASLVDDKGNSYQPTSWEGAGPGGHHREGALIFEAINPAPKYVELQMNNVGDVPLRVFKWNLE